MRTLTACFGGLALATSGLMPPSVRAQAGAAPPLTPEETEAYQISLEMAFACSPRRHNLAAGSQSTIRREPAPLAGSAVFFRSVEGTFVVLEEYDEELDGHCLVLGWFGGDLARGRYPIAQLSDRTLEEQNDSDSHTFFTVAAVRTNGENSILVAESGTLEIMTIEPSEMTGTFELTGFVVEASSRSDGVVWAGSFSAVEGER